MGNCSSKLLHGRYICGYSLGAFPQQCVIILFYVIKVQQILQKSQRGVNQTHSVHIHTILRRALIGYGCVGALNEVNLG